MMSASGFSMPRDRAGRQSVIRLIHSRWTGWNMVNPKRVAKKMDSTSDRLEASRNWMALRMLS